VAIRARDVLRQIALESELEMITGKVTSDQVPMFLASRPPPTISQIMPWWKGLSSRSVLSEFPHLGNQFGGRPLGARGYLAVSSGNITAEMIQTSIRVVPK